MVNRDKSVFKLMKLRNNGYKPLVDDLELYIVDILNTNQHLKEKLASCSESEEVQRLQKELKKVKENSLHVMSEKERESVRVFRSEHHEMCNGNVLYNLVSTGIGTSIKVQCDKCKVTKDVTDISAW